MVTSSSVSTHHHEHCRVTRYEALTVVNIQIEVFFTLKMEKTSPPKRSYPTETLEYVMTQ